MSERRQSRCVVIAYDEDAQAIEICTLLKDSLASRMERALRVPFPLEEMGFDLNDEQARIVGGVAFKLLATYQTELGPYVHVTPDPASAQDPPGRSTRRSVSVRARAGDETFGATDSFKGWCVNGSSSDVASSRLTLRLQSADKQNRIQIHFHGAGRSLTADFMAGHVLESLSSLTDLDSDEYRNARATLDRVYPWAKPISPKPVAVVRVGPDIALYIEFESVEIDPPSRYQGRGISRLHSRPGPLR